MNMRIASPAVAALLAAFTFAPNLHAQLIEGPWSYTVNVYSEATIIGYNGPAGPVVIPAAVNNGSTTVRAVGNGTDPIFQQPLASFVTTVTIPSSVSSISGKAFMNCSGILGVNIGRGVVWIGTSAFEGCTKLADVNFPPKLFYVGDYAFLNCTNLVSVTLPAKLSNIGTEAFGNTGGVFKVR